MTYGLIFQDLTRKQRIKLFLWLMLILLFPTFLFSQTLLPATTLSNQTLRIVLDDSYPPYVFRDINGNIQGILIDQWRLFEKRTKIPVEIHAMNWGTALKEMETGKYDVIDTIFKNNQRARKFNFLKPYEDIPVPIFFHKNISGITNAASLKGFKVAVKKGDNCIDILTTNGISDLKEYDNYESIIKDVRDKKILVFVIDKPSAMYYLYKYGIQDEFKFTDSLYTGQLHRATRKGDTLTSLKVSKGFLSISRADIKAINRKWMGTPIIRQEYLRYFIILLISITLIIMALVGWNAVLQNKVKNKTIALTHLLDQYKTSEERYRMLADNSHDLIVLHDLDGNILYLSPSFEIITGLKPAEFIGKNPETLLHPDDIESALTKNLIKIKEGYPTDLFEFRIKNRDGNYKWIESIARPIQDHTGKTIHILSVNRDITERKKADFDKKQLEAQVQHSQKLESLGVLAGGIAHDFNNLLAAILGNIDLALLDIPDNSIVRPYLIEAEKATHRSADLCRQLLAYSGRGRFVVNPVNLSEIVSDMTRMLEVSISKKAFLQYHLVKDLPYIEGDDSQIKQIIMNLVLNGSEALGNNGGYIRISTGLTKLNTDYLQSCIIQDSIEEGEYVYLEVEDNGSGMDRETKEKIFDPFFTTKFTGRGLGLAAVLGIVRSHKGNIRIFSEPGTGSLFQVFFPVCKTGSQAESLLSESMDEFMPVIHKDYDAIQGNIPSVPSNRTILLVDDEESIRNIGKSMLERMGHTVKLAVDGQDALDYLNSIYVSGSNLNNMLDCIILDLTMPRKDGEETFNEISQMKLDIPIVISSGYSQTEISQRFTGKGLAGFIQKPYEYKTLKNTIHQALKISLE